MKSKVEKELNKKNKIFDFKGLLHNFCANSQIELTQKQIINDDPDLSSDVKELLIKCLEKDEERAKKIDIDEVIHLEENRRLGAIRNSRATKTNTSRKNNEVNNSIKHYTKQNENGGRVDL